MRSQKRHQAYCYGLMATVAILCTMRVSVLLWHATVVIRSVPERLVVEVVRHLELHREGLHELHQLAHHGAAAKGNTQRATQRFQLHPGASMKIGRAHV